MIARRSLLACALFLIAMPALSAVEEHLELLEGPFPDGPSVTRACLDCHEDAAFDFMKTTHWTWTSEQELAGREGSVQRGKKNVINNFCISVPGNWPRCTSCHAGYGWTDADFNFENPENVDCLVCHDRTGEYKKFPTGAGHPVSEPKTFAGRSYEPLDLVKIAQQVGMPGRDNCGACHFFGGGGNGVKHGDLDQSLLDAPRDYDVHMGLDGADMTCQECHITEAHAISGNALVVSPGGTLHRDCVDCHDAQPHKRLGKILNAHDRVACQSCHIPSFAKAAPTKVWWDWSLAGRDLPAGEDRFGLPTYSKKKGEFAWDKDIVPTYAWFNGRGGAYQFGDRLDPDRVLTLNWPEGELADSAAKIYPFKLMKGKQPYDTGNRTLIVPKLFGPTGYWSTFDWDSAARQGMEIVGLEYSGSHGFVETEMYWPINHMVVPKKAALKCKACHSAEGRLDWEALGYEGDPRKYKKAKHSEAGGTIMPKNPRVTFWEINAQDGPALTAFYRSIFGWEASEEGSIPIFNLGSGGEGGIPGAIFTGQGRLPTHRCLMVEVDDVDAVCEKVKATGQAILQGPFEFQERMRLAFFEDPEGHMIGLSGPISPQED